MQKKLVNVAEQIMFALAVFILFLLVFENRLVIPFWLQPFGRMHPLLLHFPIVLLLLGVIIDVFSFKEPIGFYKSFSASLLLSGTLLAGITVVMGLFLSSEDGYTGDAVQWHKWMGVATFFLAILLYKLQKKSWYTATLARIGAVVMSGTLIGAGHYGAVLTHGDDFITAPLIRHKKPEPVNLEQALVFNDIIKPIFEHKCTSCHNPDKLKGGLGLTDQQAIQKGGKSGKLYVAGKPEISLLLKRIHLPLEEKKHMPPSGKAQLTPAELQLLAFWIKQHPDFTKKVVDLPVTDSLRMLAQSILKPVTSKEPEYSFEAADEETIRKLNSDYRTISPLAKESPALAVNLYNKATYSPERLQELSTIKQQVVYLNINKLPVGDADLKHIVQFENLRKLDANFTDLTGKTLAELSSLKHLEALALSGTNVTYTALKSQLASFKSLKTITLWETKLSEGEIAQLQKVYPTLQIIAGFDGNKSEPIRLNPPMLKNLPIFSKSTQLELRHPIKGVEIRYTTDGSEPDSITSPVLTNPIILTNSTEVKAKAYKKGWLSSSVATFNYYKSAFRPDSSTLLLPLNPVHQAEGAKTFFDYKLGTFNANSPAWANNWAGVRKNDLILVSEFKRPITITSVELRTMIEPETGIFPPSQIEIWGGNHRDQLKRIITVRPTMPTAQSGPELKAVGRSFKPQTISFLKIVAQPVSKLPDWHGNKGKQALLLVDEVFIN